MNVRFFSAIAVAVFASTGVFAAGAGNTGGGCYNLQLIKNTSKSQPLTSSNRHTIFLTSKTVIKLGEGEFRVADGNGTDGEARFVLPNPSTSAYSVSARLVGKPGSGMDLTTCGVAEDGAIYCSENTLSMSRVAGTSRFVNVNKYLLELSADIDGDGDLEDIKLFDDGLADYYWDVDAYGRLHAQLRFCPQ